MFKKLTVLPQADDSLGIRLRQQCQLQRFLSYLHVLEATVSYRRAAYSLLISDTN